MGKGTEGQILDSSFYPGDLWSEMIRVHSALNRIRNESNRILGEILLFELLASDKSSKHTSQSFVTENDDP